MRSTQQQPTQSQALAEPREARPSGEIRVVYDAEPPRADDTRGGEGLPIARPNAPVRVLPSIVVDACYLQTVSSVEARARGRKLAFAAVSAFVFGMLSMSLAEGLARQRTAPVTVSAPASSAATRVGASLQTPLAPMSADAALPHGARMDRRDAAKLVQGAEALRRAGRVRDARRLLAEVLTDRPGYPAGLAAMAELELDCGRAAAAVRWARLAVRALPSSAGHRELLRRAQTAAGPAVEARARVRR